MPAGLPELIRASSGFLLGALGLALLLLQPRTRASIGVAVILLSLVPFFTIGNLFYADDLIADPFIPAYSVLFLVASLAALALASRMPAPPRWQRAALVLPPAGAAIAGALYLLVPYEGLDPALAIALNAQDVTIAIFGGCLAALFCLLAHRARVAPEAREAAGSAYLAAATALYPLPLTLLVDAAWTGSDLVVIVAASALQSLPFAVGLVLLARARAGAAPRAATTAFAIVVASTALALVGWATPLDPAVVGIVRILVFAVLLGAIVRFGALGHDLRPTTSHRAWLAAVGLASLLIVAQLAQGFVPASASLVIGAMVSVGAIFAQRAIERNFERRPDRASRSEAAEAARERSFLAAARKFHKDGVISREEERELLILAEHLGIPPSRAYELRDEVERDRG